MGSAVQFFDAVWKEYGRTSYTVVRVSEASEQRYLQSSFTACIHELALKTTDACVGNFWPTLDRRLLASFTSAIYEDTFHLVAFAAVEESNLLFVWLGPSCLLFTLQEWIALLGFLFYAAIVTWLIEGSSDKEGFQHVSRVNGIARSVFNHLQSFVGIGDFRNHSHTQFGRIVVLTVSFSMLVAATKFTASMTVQEFAGAQVKPQYESLDDLIKDNGRVCGLEANRRGFGMRYPGTLPLYDSYTDVDEALKAMGSKMCKGVIVTKDEWDQRKKLADHCDKYLIPTTLLSMSNAFAMRDDLVVPFSWAMTKLQNQGVYSQIQTLAKETYVEPLPDKCVRNKQDATSPTTLLTGPILLSTVVITLTLLVFAAVDTRKALTAEEGGDEVFNVPSLKTRICREFSRRKSLTEDDCRITANDSDLKIIGRVFEARHTTEERLRHKVQADAPLTVADVPMLVRLMKQDMYQTSMETQKTSSDLAEKSSDQLPEALTMQGI
ncbi:unnamed protein product [Polarella glacialis]|uniref:Ionotropic glutamate receptor C-terminal domain-containing protein n=1 Tax=Polarella glacialis TaxID=89957 RepID=A0A813LPM1_POLGL|nr:unnamed protein product [Polarella glacialis]